MGSKFLGAITVPSVFTWYAARSFLGTGKLAASGLSFLGAFGGMLGYGRVQIQGGYIFDYRYRKGGDLTGKTVLITGATVGGLGHEAAKMLAGMGATALLRLTGLVFSWLIVLHELTGDDRVRRR